MNFFSSQVLKNALLSIMDNKLFFPEIIDENFLHPTDKMALNAVNKVKGLECDLFYENKWKSWTLTFTISN